MEHTTMRSSVPSPSRPTTFAYNAFMFRVTRMHMPESRICRSISRSAYRGLTLTTVPPALSTA